MDHGTETSPGKVKMKKNKEIFMFPRSLPSVLPSTYIPLLFASRNQEVWIGHSSACMDSLVKMERQLSQSHTFNLPLRL